MKQSASLMGNPTARRGASRLFALALVLLTLALALPAGAAAVPAPRIASFTPHQGLEGSAVTLAGSGFTDATRVALGRSAATFTVVSDAEITLTVPTGARSGKISVSTAGGSDWSAESFTVTYPSVVILVTAPTGTGSYAQGSTLTVSWTTKHAVDWGEFGVWVGGGSQQTISYTLVPASGAASYTTGLTLNVPVGSDYKAVVAWRPYNFTPWSASATSPGSFTVTASPAKAITAFSFQGLTPPVTGVIDEAAHTIALTVPRATDLHDLVATFTTTGASVSVGGTPQVSGTTAKDFSSPVIYKVTAGDGSTQHYVVTVSLHVLDIGDAYGGGVIAYLLQSGDPGYSTTVQHGLIAATGDQNGGWGIIWALPRYERALVPGGTGTAIGTGAANTTKITYQNGMNSDYAAGLARAYMGGGYRDWYLPSKDELNKLWLNRGAVGGFYPALYWSSSEDDASHAWYQSFNYDRGESRRGIKHDTFRVRAVRSF